METTTPEVQPTKRASLARTTIYFTANDKKKIRQIAKRENLRGATAVVRWAINEVLK